jgi:hypothetical protein
MIKKKNDTLRFLPAYVQYALAGLLIRRTYQWMLEQPSHNSAKRTANTAESSTVQPMLCVQVRNMGTRLLWIWF